MIRLYVGHDPREAIGTHVFLSSLLRHTSVPVSVTYLHKPMLARALGYDIRDGSNAFTLSRFLIPWLDQWRGWSIFMDGADMLLRTGLEELASMFDPWKAVQVVKHDYRTKHARKYIGTVMESDNIDYPRKNWSSVMIVHSAHYAWRKVTPRTMKDASKLEMLNFSWLEDELIGSLPNEWNWLADEYGDNANARLLHWTAGVPGFQHYRQAPHADEWIEACRSLTMAL